MTDPILRYMHPGRVAAMGLPSDGRAFGKLTPADVATHAQGIPGVVLIALIAGPRTTEQLMQLVYGGTPDGSPNTARECIYNAVSELRKRLKAGWEIASVISGHHWHRRYELRRRAPSDRDVT